MRDWHEVGAGHTTAEVRRSPDGSTYAKTASDAPARAELADERDRAAWLAGTGLGLEAPDEERLAFYRLLDELF